MLTLLVFMCLTAASENAVAIALSMLATIMLTPEIVLSAWWLPHVRELFPVESFEVPELVLLFGGATVAAMAVKNIFSTATAVFQASFATQIEMELGRRILSLVSAVDMAWLNRQDTSALILAAHWRQYVYNYLGGLAQCALSVLVCLSLFIALLYSSPAMSIIVFFACGILCAFLFALFKSRMHWFAAKYASACSVINDLFFMAIQGARDMKCFRAYPQTEAEYEVEAKIGVSSRKSQAFFASLPSASFDFITVGVLVLVVYMLLTGAIGQNSALKTTEQITLLGAVAWRALPSVNRFLTSLASLKNFQPMVERVLNVMDELQSEVPSTKPIEEDTSSTAMPFQQEIKFEHVSFSYGRSEPLVIEDLTLRLKARQSVGIAGGSGAGKSTLANLLMGLYSPTTGSIRIDGSSLIPETAPHWFARVGYVPQEPYLCNGPLYRNIAFGVDPAAIDMDRVLQCCGMAAIDFVPLTDEGMRTQAGERGTFFSGGQKQRIAIARALYHNPALLIFDEATSALDDANERAVIDTVYSLGSSLTLFMIAHRLSTLERCDRVLVLEAGKIIADGDASVTLHKYAQHLATVEKR